MFFRRRRQPPPTFEEQVEAAAKRGFTIEGNRVSKDGCAAVIERLPDGHLRFIEKPGLVIDGEIAHLEDRGYQKFLITRAHGARPAVADQLKAIHRFSEEIRRVFRFPSLYNESLGTVSDRYWYDRVNGRP